MLSVEPVTSSIVLLAISMKQVNKPRFSIIRIFLKVDHSIKLFLHKNFGNRTSASMLTLLKIQIRLI